jgi:hypothetical protein
MHTHRIAGQARLQGDVRDETVATLIHRYRAALDRGDLKAARAFKAALHATGRFVDIEVDQADPSSRHGGNP